MVTSMPLMLKISNAYILLSIQVVVKKLTRSSESALIHVSYPLQTILTPQVKYH